MTSMTGMTGRTANGEFPQTSWTLIHDARTRAEAFGRLFELYRAPMHAYMRARSRSRDENVVEDLVSGFVTRMLSNGFLDKADPARGSFRAYLMVSMKRHAIDEFRKRRPEAELAAWSDPGHIEEAERVFQEQSYSALLSLGIQELERQCRSAGLSPHWRAFEMKMVLPLFGTKRPSNAEIAAATGIEPAKVSGAFQTVTRRMWEAFRIVMRDHCAPAVIDEEIASLWSHYGINVDALDTRLRRA